jgi:NAD(P)H-flavin reductase/ferredoxin
MIGALINGRRVAVGRKETLLDAALRGGVDFPNSCRVGGCASCKCQLVSGRVKELTESAYILSDEEVKQGFILACQSVPLSDVSVKVELDRPALSRASSGHITAQHKLTHDITQLDVQLDQPMQYRAGQFTDLSIAALPGVRRSYSFATPAQQNGMVSFFVRKVPAGRFSSLVNDTDVCGERVTLSGASGDFWLRPAAAPMLLVAGGSGLAPMLALLQDALDSGVSRSVTLLFGAREEKDLYALDQINSIAAQWPGRFRFIPVLSDAAADASWRGARGLVTEQIPEVLERGAHAYLCGPPGMIDSAVAQLRAQGVGSEHIHADRFLTQNDVPKAKPAGVLHYLKYFLFVGVSLVALAGILLGGSYIGAALAATLSFYLIGDAISGDDTSTPVFEHPGLMTAQVWLALPMLAMIVLAAVWQGSQPATTLGQEAALVVLTGLMIGLIGTVPGHELTHRTWDPRSMLIGRWLLAFSFDTIFAIEHVYGHHRYVSTTEDPATAPRGRNVYAHVVISTIRGNLSAWHIECKRLARKGYGVLSWHNAFIRGHLMSAALVVAAWGIGGWQGALLFTLCGLWGKSLLEIVNYMEHYGMVRNPLAPVQPRHSWNTNRRLSSWTMFNLTRHSHHHAQGEVPYHELRPYPDAPMMVGGYLTTIVVAMIPPLWHHLMVPKVLAWDRDYANAEERLLAAQANARSGMAAFQRSVASPAG